MGCSQSAREPGPSKAYDICHQARSNGTPIDVVSLRAAAGEIALAVLNEVANVQQKTALEEALLHIEFMPATQALLEIGADPIAGFNASGDKPLRYLDSTALGIAVRYPENIAVVPLILDRLDQSGWAVLKEHLGRSPPGKDIGESVRVRVGDKTGTSLPGSAREHMFGGATSESHDVIGVKYDGGELAPALVPRADVEVLRQLSDAARQAVLEGAKRAKVDPETLASLEGILVGSWMPYGV